MKEPLFTINHLTKVYDKTVAVDNLSLDIYPGETLGLVGESGCGKSTIGRCILQLEKPTSGNVLFLGKPVDDLFAFRRSAQIIFQDPYSSLNPRMTAGEIIAEPLKIHGLFTSFEVVEALALQVGLSPYLLKRFPHEFSGGQRQRIGIARALALRPQFIVCDEPISALDIPIQAQIINLLKELQKTLGLTYLFITHNLSVVRYISDRIAVIYKGNLVELCDADTLYTSALHPYTQLLLSSIPSLSKAVTASMPDTRLAVKGCPFAPRCPHAMPRCFEEKPELKEVSPGHFVSCYLLK
ncbi:MAG: hypothetical protein RLZZ453_1241 [Chlamydiota bacterium]|jgi:peptide/nickel transport system ATP-binding protein/oligopeptide transport system ATP-binding protein